LSSENLIIEEINLSAGKNLKKLRNYKELTLEQLASDLKLNIESIKGYENNNVNPSLGNLIKIANFFNVSIDFLILWDKAEYPKNIKLLSLAKEIDSLDQSKRFQIESTASTLLKSKENKISVKMDNKELSNSIHDNIKSLRESKKITQKKLAEYLGVSQNQIYLYEKNSIPPIDKLIKLSEFFETSIHALSTGKNLSFSFGDRYFGETMFLADHFLSLEDHKFIIKLMENVIQK
jgi:transcriptional regulator with XRE-family HTH domain